MTLFHIAIVIISILPRFPEVTNAAKILFLCPQLPSHVQVQIFVASELAARGHEVYMAMGSPFDQQERLESVGIRVLYYHIPGDVLYGLTDELNKALSDLAFSLGFPEYVASVMINRDCSLMMEDEQFKRTAKEMNFSLAVAEPFTYCPCNLILPRYLEVPFVSMATVMLPWEMRLPALPSFHHVLGWFPIVDLNTFYGRVISLIEFIIAETSLWVPGACNFTLLRKYAPDLESCKELVKKSELLLTDIDHHMGEPMPAFPYYVGVPGLSVSSPRKLDPEWEAVLNGNENGIVVMSLGSMVSYIPRATLTKLMEAFSRLNQTVVARMKQPGDGMELPANVKASDWLPQNDLLGHPNTRLFVTHCGNSGQHEMLYHGVPFIGLPMFGDQDMNCQQAQDKGFGIKLNMFEFTSEELFAAMVEVLNNPKYKSAVKRGSEIFRDQPMNGRQKAAFWIEHVLKFGGGHLRSRALDLPLYQFLMLDIIAAFVVLCFVIFKMVKFLLKKIIKVVSYWNLESPTKQHENSRITKRKSS